MSLDYYTEKFPVVWNMKRSIFLLFLMGIFVIKLVKKTGYRVFLMALITPALLTPDFIYATHKNNANLGPALYGPIR